MKLMKIKLSWITFIPVALIVLAVKTLQSLNVQLPLNSVYLSYLTVGLVLVMFLINIIFCAVDKKTSPVYILSRNIVASVFALLTATFLTSKSVLTIITEFQASSINAVKLITAIVGIFAAIAFVLVALAHFQGRNFMPRLGAYFLFMPAWACLMLICEFLDNRTVSTLTIDPIKLFVFAFAVIYLFKNSMVIATIEGKNPVKSCYLYGFPLIALGLGFGAKTIAEIFVKGLDYSENCLGFAIIALALYVLSELVEITRFSKSNDEQIVKFDVGDIDENQRVYGAESDRYLAISENEDGDYEYDYGIQTDDSNDFVTEVDYSYLTDNESTPEHSDDFVVMSETTDSDDEEAIYVARETADDFETNITGSAETSGEDSVSDDVTDDEIDEARLEEIDRLISDINSSSVE